MSLSLYNSTIVPLLSNGIFLGREYDNILDFAEINIAIKCDTGYILTFIYSQDKLTADYQTSQTISAQVDTKFFTISVKDRYFKLKIEANDGDMSVLNVQTIYKSTVTYQVEGNIPSSNVTIVNPLNLDGSVFVGGNLALTGSVDANITNTSLDVNVTNPVTSVDANITNTSLDVSDGDTHTKLDTIQTQLEKSNKGTSTLWSNNITGVNGVSLILNLSNVNQSNLTIFGSVDGATNLVVQFSNDGTNFYDSQYSYVQSASGNWGFNITACPLYLRLKSTSSVTAYAFVNYS
jgi:hypothetical protein